MERRINNNNINSREKGVCEKIFNALAMSSGFMMRRRIRHHEQTSNKPHPNHHEQTSIKPHPNQQPPRHSAVPSKLHGGQHNGYIPIVIEGHSDNHIKVGDNHHVRRAKEDKTGKKTSAISWGDSGSAKSRVNGGSSGVIEHAFSAYIDDAGSRIRAGSNVGRPGKVVARKDTINSKVSDYINRTKIRFQSPSGNDQ